MFDWLGDFIGGIGDAIGSTFDFLGEQISNAIWNTMLQWFYETIYNAVADFFTMMGNMGADIFDTEKYINNVILQVDDAMTNFVDITHLLDYYICAGDRSIDSSNIDGLSAEISADSMFKEIVINDIFLDIAYFNSYSFLRNMTTIAKKNFSKMKAEFFYKKKLDSFFDNDPNVVLDYYSFAFSCHNEDDNEFKFDIYKYIQLWDEFIMEYYPNEVHKERKISEQIEMRIDEHIPKDYFTKFANLQQGIYFILRINKKDIPVKKIDYVLSLFNIDDISVGELCIISSEKLIKSYENHFELYDELYIAAFKVVVQ